LLTLLIGLQSALVCFPVHAQDQCQTILNSKCTRCHYLTRVCQELGKKTKRSWKRTINNMIRYGAKLSGEERDILLDCLGNAAPGDTRICEY